MNDPDPITIIIDDPELVAMLERTAARRGVTPTELVEILVRVHAMDIDTLHDRRQGKAK